MSLNDDDMPTDSTVTLYIDESGKVPITWDKNPAARIDWGQLQSIDSCHSFT